MDHDEARVKLLDAAEELFYARGIQAVGMDAIRSGSGVSLKRLYQYFPAKGDLVEAYLRRRDERWRRSLVDYVEAHSPGDRVPAVFDWLRGWFSEDDFRGCAFINSFGELGEGAPGVARVAREHKDSVRGHLRAWAGSESLGDQIFALVEGATVIAGITGDPTAADTAKAAAQTLLRAASAG
ncbi:TetR/AcrR family transcriptional regulator [Amycolatopsis thermophila]|uniref:AcrR family transcriptional regulator n=1 Tax=Amycolatopsis thermophila TaxID=206084 RepID=A0ABU0ENK4_9PSEU|nr:TetR/AcrR family transcriptional regulator [Amycolatopsis thermophila]MDQ0376878.1 AcrR family transcriptional regulator [Amycolatopsis thermophila]